MSQGAVVDLACERDKRTARSGPFIAVFHDTMNDVADRMKMHHNEWRALYWCIARCNYGQTVPVSGPTHLGRQLKIGVSTARRVLARLQQYGILYQHDYSWYLSAYIAYKGKLNALAKVRQWEDLIKAAIARGEQLAVDLGEEVYYAGGIPTEVDYATHPDWLEDA